MKTGGLEYEISYSESVACQAEEFQSTEFLNSFIPVDLVTGLVSHTYERPEWKQPVLDALSPFQITSKLWATSVLAKIIGEDYERSPILFFGSWFGQMNSLLARKMLNYHNRRVALIDIDPLACQMAQYVRESDQWLISQQDVAIVCGDALTYDLSAFADECGAEPIVVWTGIEHFEEGKVKRYIEDHQGAKAIYLLQGTNMPADDHVNPITSCEALEQYFDSSPIYSAELKTELGSRFQLVFAT